MKYVVFDFDGTLADSLPLVINIAEEVLGVKITDKEIEHYRNLTARQVLKIAKIPLWRVPSLLVKGRPIMSKRLHEVKIFEGLADVIKDLNANGHSLYVVSSNSAGIINGFLAQQGIKQYFTSIYGNVGLFSKAQAIKKVMKREGFTLKNAIYIGDEVRDIEAATKINMPIISVTWGYNGEKILASYKPTYLVRKPKEISKIVNG